MIRYTAKHSSGAVKTRTSRGHVSARYTHAVWARKGSKEWSCVSMGKETTAVKSAASYQSCGWEVEITEIEAGR